MLDRDCDTNGATQNFGTDVEDKASIYVPAIGKVTIVVLLRNLLVGDEVSRCQM